jgi:hypothetical protein
MVCATGRQTSELPGSTRATVRESASANFRSPAPSADIAAATPIPNAIDFANDACTSSGGKVGVEMGASAHVPRADGRQRGAGWTDYRERPAATTSRALEGLLESADSDPGCTAHRKPEPAGASARTQQPLALLGAQRALHRETGRNLGGVRGDRRPTPPLLVDRPAPGQPDEEQRGRLDRSCTSVTRAWFADAERPVTNAWSVVARGINVRWNVSGAFAAANKTPAWSARPPSDRLCPFAMARP